MLIDCGQVSLNAMITKNASCSQNVLPRSFVWANLIQSRDGQVIQGRSSLRRKIPLLQGRAVWRWNLTPPKSPERAGFFRQLALLRSDQAKYVISVKKKNVLVCNRSTKPFSAFKHTWKFWSMWLAYQYFVGTLSCFAYNCKQGIIGIDKCVKGPLPMD